MHTCIVPVGLFQLHILPEKNNGQVDVTEMSGNVQSCLQPEDR